MGFFVSVILVSLIAAFIFLKIKNLGPLFSMAYMKIFFGAVLVSFISYTATGFLGLVNSGGDMVLIMLIVGSLVGAWGTSTLMAKGDQSDGSESNIEGHGPTKVPPKRVEAPTKITAETPTQHTPTKPIIQKEESLEESQIEKLDPTLFFDLKDLIAENKFVDAIDKLKQLIREGTLDDQHYNNLVIAKSRLDSVENAVSNGTMSHDQENLELNKIRTSILRIIDSAK
jgi:hypothetical protein